MDAHWCLFLVYYSWRCRNCHVILFSMSWRLKWWRMYVIFSISYCIGIVLDLSVYSNVISSIITNYLTYLLLVVKTPTSLHYKRIHSMNLTIAFLLFWIISITVWFSLSRVDLYRVQIQAETTTTMVVEEVVARGAEEEEEIKIVENTLFGQHNLMG